MSKIQFLGSSGSWFSKNPTSRGRARGGQAGGGSATVTGRVPCHYGAGFSSSEPGRLLASVCTGVPGGGTFPPLGWGPVGRRAGDWGCSSSCDEHSQTQHPSGYFVLPLGGLTLPMGVKFLACLRTAVGTAPSEHSPCAQQLWPRHLRDTLLVLK